MAVAVHTAQLSSEPFNALNWCVRPLCSCMLARTGLASTLTAELTTQQTHGAFKEFVAAWNTGQLPLRFYQGLAAAPLKRTSYTWGFNAKAGSAAAGAGAAEAGKLGMAAFLQDQQEQ